MESEADKKEKEYIRQFESRTNGYNSAPGGVWYNPKCNYNYDELAEVDLAKEYYSKMSHEDIYYACKLVEKLFKLQSSQNAEYNIEILNKYYHDITYYTDIPVTYYAFEGEFETKYCNGLEYLEDFLEIAGQGLSLWKSIYFDMSDKVQTSESYIQLKNEIEKTNKYEIDKFISQVSSSELFNYFSQADKYMKDLSCGDCISLGIPLRYKYL